MQNIEWNNFFKGLGLSENGPLVSIITYIIPYLVMIIAFCGAWFTAKNLIKMVSAEDTNTRAEAKKAVFFSIIGTFLAIVIPGLVITFLANANTISN